MTHEYNITFLKGYLPRHCSDIYSTGDEIVYFASGGGTHIYTFAHAGSRYAARVNFYPGKNEWEVKKAEFDILEKLTKHNYAYAPHVYHFCRYSESENTLGQDFTVVNFAEGEDFSKVTIADSDIVLMARALRDLHAIESVTTDELYECEIYDEFAEGSDKHIESYSATDFPGITEFYETFNNYKNELGDWFHNLEIFAYQLPQVLCHADLKKENILKTPNGICLIDFECAGLDCIETDIGRLFAGCDFTDEQCTIFIDEYFTGNKPDELVMARINAVRIVLEFFGIIDQYCSRKTKIWNYDNFVADYNNWYKGFVSLK